MDDNDLIQRDKTKDAINPVEIDVNHGRSIAHWTQVLDVSEAALRMAVADVGPAVSDVRDILGR